jgi:60 kDa SS-A/Ro ribonucleoprotein
MKNYSRLVTNTPQSESLLGSNQVKNNAGGYSFKISAQEQLERFLLIGSEGGTYYVSEQNLTKENAESIVNHIKFHGTRVVETVLDFAENRRAPNPDAGIFVLALVTAFGDEEAKNKAYSAISKVCQTSTHLFMFLANVQNLRGWSRGLRKGVAKFYTSRTPEQLAYQLVKYRNREGFTHKDALRLSHPKSTDPKQNELFSYIVGKMTEAETSSDLIRAFGEAQSSTKHTELVDLLKKNENLTWEMIPNEMLNDGEVLKVLAKTMPFTALMRNLNRFSYNELTNGNTATTRTIVEKLTNKELVLKAGLHPLNVVKSILTYSSGHGNKGNKTWTPNQQILDALDTTFKYSVESLTSTGKKILIGVDISGSMNSPVGGMGMSASTLANVLAVTMLKSEPNSELVWFDTEIQHPTLGRRSSLDEVLKTVPDGGGTDCAQPLHYALDNQRFFDAIIILTDNETWAGRSHGAQVIELYRNDVNANVKVIEVAMVSNPISNLPDDDKNLLRVVGFDSSVVDVINAFIG